MTRTLSDIAAFAKKLSDQGQDPQATTPAELTAHMRAESDRYSKIIKAAGVTTAQ